MHLTEEILTYHVWMMKLDMYGWLNVIDWSWGISTKNSYGV